MTLYLLVVISIESGLVVSGIYAVDCSATNIVVGCSVPRQQFNFGVKQKMAFSYVLITWVYNSWL